MNSTPSTSIRNHGQHKDSLTQMTLTSNPALANVSSSLLTTMNNLNLTENGKPATANSKVPVNDKSSQASKQAVMDDQFGNLIYEKGDVMCDRYEIMDTLGVGASGKVVKVKDLEKNQILAMKILKTDAQNYEAKREINVLQELADKDPTGKYLWLKMIEWFDYLEHICITFEMLGLSVYDFQNANNNRQYPMEQVRHISYQLCHAVNFLHENKLTHTDLKPENILFVKSDYDESEGNGRTVRNTDVRLIDFGLAIFDHENHPALISTSNFRAPEVILELGWGQPSDVWSVGCIMFELYTGIPLFEPQDNKEHLAMMQRVLDPMPLQLSERSRTKYFHKGKLNWDANSDGGKYISETMYPLLEYMQSRDEDTCELFSLLFSMLSYDAASRIPIKRAILHPFFKKIPSHLRISGFEMPKTQKSK